MSLDVPTIEWEIRGHEGLVEVKLGYVNFGDVPSIIKIIVRFTPGVWIQVDSLLQVYNT